MKKIETTREDLLDWWLSKYHNTNVNELIKKHTEQELSTTDWFKLYPVTKEQEQEWVDWAKKKLMKEYKVSSKEIFDKAYWCWIYLDCSPYVINN